MRLFTIMFPCIILLLVACGNKQENMPKTAKDSNLDANSNNKSLESANINNERGYKDSNYILQKRFSKKLLLAQKDYKKLCDKDNADSCVKLALSHQLNYSATQDEIYDLYIKASEIYNNECQNGNMNACSGLGALYESGDGVEQNIYKSRVLYKKACDGKDSRGCLSLGLEIIGCISCKADRENIKRALPYFEKACKYGNKNACYMKIQSQNDLYMH